MVEKTIDDYIKDLESREKSVRFLAIMELEERKAKEAVEPLIKSLKNDDSPDLRMHAARALGVIGDASAIDALKDALGNKEEDWRVRQGAAKALGDIGNESTIDALNAASKGDIDAFVRESAREALEKIKNKKNEITPEATVNERGGGGGALGGSPGSENWTPAKGFRSVWNGRIAIRRTRRARNRGGPDRQLQKCPL